MSTDSAEVPRPTPSAERIDAIDVLRGIALFGVMAINLVMEFRVSIFDQFQSIIFGWIFYGYGLGLFGRLGITPALVIGIAVYVGQVRFSAWWLHHHRYGPLEWLWRSLMYGERQPMAAEPGAAMQTQLSSRTSEAQIRDP